MSGLRFGRRPVLGGCWLFIIALALLFTGCADRTEPPRPTVTRPAAYRPDQFPDIPLLAIAGYALAPEPQLAVSYAGGSMRQLQVAYQTRPGTDETPEQPLARFARDLMACGWVLEPPNAYEPLSQRWRKQAELLLISAGRFNDGTTIRLRLRSASAAAEAGSSK